MEPSEREDFIIQKYKQEEQLMILLFAQWCVNHDLDPAAIYKKAFPAQTKNQQLTEAVEQTLPKSEADEIPLPSLLEVLSWFEQDELAFIVSEEANQLEKR
ncbi:hypothetical protein [Alkalicoccobacillus murimartini]|uniref:YxiS n=1 Tax=Alkalicoccobacillus murimartini TaxID=171685 RepID=A0ABT9YED0_9BACI|nr:hypothetical protein [Alkalicoccobacillus murimartini]MDQ0206079.1 hypothetical protein [Alkalicoccobacillus murimartini]